MIDPSVSQYRAITVSNVPYLLLFPHRVSPKSTYMVSTTKSNLAECLYKQCKIISFSEGNDIRHITSGIKYVRTCTCRHTAYLDIIYLSGIVVPFLYLFLKKFM